MRRVRQVGGELDAGAQIKVADLDRRQLVLAHAQNVLRLQVAVRDSLLVQEVQPRGDLLHNLRRVVLREAHVLLDPRQQGSPVDLRTQGEERGKGIGNKLKILFSNRRTL